MLVVARGSPAGTGAVAVAKQESDCKRIFGLERLGLTAPGHDGIRARESQSMKAA